jgi:hypothetical protein
LASSLYDRISAQFKELVELANKFLQRSRRLRYPLSDEIFDEFRAESESFYVRAENLLIRVCGYDSAHVRRMKEIRDPKSHRFSSWDDVNSIVGVLEGARADFESGMLLDIRRLEHADVLDDFLGQAEALLQQNFVVPSASLVGAVLEDTLRTLCGKFALTVPEKTKIDKLNSDLAKAGAYDKLVQKQVTAYADIRNNADHGHFDKVRAADVEEMVRWVRRFTSEHLN